MATATFGKYHTGNDGWIEIYRVNIEVINIPFPTELKNIHMERTLSQIFYLGLSFYFFEKKRVTYDSFFKLHFLDFIN